MSELEDVREELVQRLEQRLRLRRGQHDLAVQLDVTDGREPVALRLRRLQAHLEAAGIAYTHLVDLGTFDQPVHTLTSDLSSTEGTSHERGRHVSQLPQPSAAHPCFTRCQEQP